MENKYFLYKQNTIIEIEKDYFSFITLLAIKSIPREDWKSTKKQTQDTHDQSLLKPLLISLDAFEIPTFFNKGNLGTVYKFMHFYERSSTLQKELLSMDKTSDRINSIGQDAPRYTPNEQYKIEKLHQKVETIANYEHYEKTDFITIKTMFHASKLVDGEEKVSEDGQIQKISGLEIDIKDFKKHFDNYTPEKWKKDKEVIDSIHIEHLNKYTHIQHEMEDTRVVINKSNLIEWFSKLSLSTFKTTPLDLDFIPNNILNYSEDPKEDCVFISTDEFSPPLKIVSFFPEKVTVFNRITNKTITYKINIGESVEVLTKDKVVVLVKIYRKNGIRIEKVIDTTTKTSSMITRGQPVKKINKSFFLTAVPPHIKDNLTYELSKDIIESLLPDTFAIHIEIFKLPQLQQIAQTESKITALEFFNILPSLGGKVYNKRHLMDKIEALTASVVQISENTFYSTRYSFGYTKKIDLPKDRTLINTKIKKFGINDFSEAIQTLDKAMLPWSFTKYILDSKARDSYLELPDVDIFKLINLKFSQKTLSFDRPRDGSDISQISNSCFFIKNDEEVMGIDIFKGPEKFNGLIIAPSGSGKSFFAVNMLDGFISAGKNNLVWILDRGGSFYRFTETYDGVNKELTLSSDKNSINPFGLSLSMIIMLKIQFFEQVLNSSKKLTPEDEVNAIKEINDLIKITKIISINTNAAFFVVDDEASSQEYGKMDDLAKQKLDILIFRTNEDETKVDFIKTEFFITQIQDTFSVLTSILLSMLSIETKSEDVRTAYQTMAPIVLRYLFIMKLNIELNGVNLLTNYDINRNEISSVQINNTHSVSYEEIIFDNEDNHITKKDILFKTRDEVVDFANINIYFIISEIKEALEEYIDKDKDIDADSQAVLHLKELDFYISELQAGKLFNTPPPADLSSETLVNIDLGESQDERLTTVIPSALMMNFFKVLTSPSKKGSNKILLIDEAHAILGSSNTSGLEAIAYLFRTARKHGGAIWLISQSIGDFHQPNDPVKAQKFDALIKNAGWRILLGSGHEKTDEVLGFSGDSVEFARKSKEGSEKYKMIIDMDGKSISVADLVVSATDYWNSTTHAAEKQVLDMLYVMTRSSRLAKTIASQIFNSSTGGMRATYPSIQALQEANPASTKEDTLVELRKKTTLDYSDIETSKIYQNYKTVKALLSEADKKSVNLTITE